MGCGHVSAWLWIATLGMCVYTVDALGIGQGTVFESTAAPGGKNALYLHMTSQGGAFVAGNEIAVRPSNLSPFPQPLGSPFPDPFPRSKGMVQGSGKGLGRFVLPPLPDPRTEAPHETAHLSGQRCSQQPAASYCAAPKGRSERSLSA